MATIAFGREQTGNIFNTEEVVAGARVILRRFARSATGRTVRERTGTVHRIDCITAANIGSEPVAQLVLIDTDRQSNSDGSVAEACRQMIYIDDVNSGKNEIEIDPVQPLPGMNLIGIHPAMKHVEVTEISPTEFLSVSPDQKTIF